MTPQDKALIILMLSETVLTGYIAYLIIKITRK
jgi:hypothetical protein